jgi:hypothetical protein
VDTHDRLTGQIAAEQDDLLATLQLIGDDEDLGRRLCDQLVDLLVESMFLDLRGSYLRGELDRDDYVAELGVLARRCREAGLLPLQSSPRIA